MSPLPTGKDAKEQAPIAQSWHHYEQTADSWKIVANHDVNDPPTTIPMDIEASPRLVLATWNVRAISPEPARRIITILEHLINHAPSPDIIFLQEVSRSMLNALLTNDKVRDGWFSSERNTRNWIGTPLTSFATMTLLSKAKFGHVGRAALVGLGRISRIKYRSIWRRDALCSEVFIPSRRPSTPTGAYERLQLVNVHLDSLPSGASCRQTQLKLIGSLLHDAGHGLVAGDFNPVSPDTDAGLVEENGLLDAWKELKGEEHGYTWGVDGTAPFPPNRLDKVAMVGLRPIHINVLHPMQILLPGEDNPTLSLGLTMEHLPIPRDPIRGHPAIQLGTKQFHEPGSFLDYPMQHGGVLDAQYPHVPTQADALQGRFTAGISHMQVIDYYQGWLFYSLIQEFLGNLYQWQNYTSWSYDDQGKLNTITLSTRTLHEDLASLRASGALASIRPGDEQEKHLNECLNQAFTAFDEIELRFPGFPTAFAEETLCLASLGETLDSAVQTALIHGPVDSELHTLICQAELRGRRHRPDIGVKADETAHVEMNKSIQHFPKSAKRPWFSKVAPLLDLSTGEVKLAMIKAGWCPGDIAKISDSFDTIAAFYYLSKFKADPTVVDLHKECDQYGCGLRIPAEPKHMSEACDCPGMVTFDEEDLIKIYQKGNVPCFCIGRLEDGSLGIGLTSCSIDEESQKDPDNHFVALSHVWSEGMGNPAANALPFCQLAYVQHWAMMAYQAVEEKEEDDPRSGTGIVIHTKPKIRQLNIWIDTMCCPATPGYGKNLCLSMMREIYSNAYVVMVRSAVLEAMELGDIVREPAKGVMDVAAQVYLSPYMRRMWTLQEAVLAGASRARGIGDRLCLSFADGILTLESIIILLKQAPPQEALLAYRFMAEFRDLSTHMWQFGDDDDGKPMKHNLKGFDFFMNMLTVALKYRNVTVASDEVICLATLLNLRINSTRGVVPLIGQGETPEEGMCELWRRLQALGGSLPSDLIFSCVPRVQEPGFRWAPGTLVQYAKHGSLYVSHSSAYPTEITDKGLHVRLPGARLTSLIAAPDIIGRMLPKVSMKDEKFDKTSQPEQENTPPSVFMIKLQADDDRWFAVRVHGDEDDAQQSGSVQAESRSNLGQKRNLLQLFRGDSTALVYQNVNITGPGLLVSIVTPPSDLSALEVLSLNPEPLQARSAFPVKIVPLSGGACVIAEAASSCVEKLNHALGARARQQGGGEDIVSTVWENAGLIAELFWQTAERLVGESSALREALYFEVLSGKAFATFEAAVELFTQYVRKVAYFGGGMRCETYPEDQDWYVD
ncbi:HET domain-containing protein [Colletotrichum orchidophilum]|uniref:HET domain-containing protein n=1 Tax=Colletotrichum orchidophilum TaxID=1209926 RepID=A0A1G4BEJ9_9PEZI|nr:HET domain-containing protein [Colletotrichum orchidophilum]OHE99767.1 HET domain-containing protein [Colletotrichum orchidophilum]